ncbi:hypothetical protein DYB32_010938, partial [Aphanomyces invadans]
IEYLCGRSGRAKSFLVVLDGLEGFLHTPYHTVVVLDFLPAILKEMPNVTVIMTSLQPIAFPQPSILQFHVALDTNPGGFVALQFHALSSDSSWDNTTRLPNENYDMPHVPSSPTHSPVAAAAPANCSVM